MDSSSKPAPLNNEGSPTEVQLCSHEQCSEPCIENTTKCAVHSQSSCSKVICTNLAAEGHKLCLYHLELQDQIEANRKPTVKFADSCPIEFCEDLKVPGKSRCSKHLKGQKVSDGLKRQEPSNAMRCRIPYCKNTPAARRKSCQLHLDKHRQWRQGRTDKGICIKCKEPAIPGESKCLKHKAPSVTTRKITPPTPCARIACNEMAFQGRVFCKRHTEMRNRAALVRREKHRTWLSKGLCMSCGQPRASGTNMYCALHLEHHRQKQREAFLSKKAKTKGVLTDDQGSADDSHDPYTPNNQAALEDTDMDLGTDTEAITVTDDGSFDEFWDVIMAGNDDTELEMTMNLSSIVDQDEMAVDPYTDTESIPVETTNRLKQMRLSYICD